MRHSSRIFPLAFLLVGCGSPSEPGPEMEQTGGTFGNTGGGGVVQGSGGQPETGGASSGGTAGSSGGMSSSGGSLGSDGGSDSGGSGGSDPSSGGAPSAGGAEGTGGEPALEELAQGLHELFIHDACTGVQQGQDDTCTHEQLIEETVTLGGDPSSEFLVSLRIRGLFEPTTISGGQSPMPEHPYFVVGGTVQATDYSQWQIEVQSPPAIYYLNHYPQTSHTIYQEDFEIQIPIAGGSDVTVRVVDANDRQIDNGTPDLPDRQQIIDGVTDEVLDGQMLRLDVLEVAVAD